MTEKYVGSTWRSRFLRAPKVAFELAERRDFIRLDLLATAHLGLKTGADKFFYVFRSAKDKGRRNSYPQRSPGLVEVEGLGGGWRGCISARDLLPAILNPHQLIGPGGRRFVVPQNTDALYVHPRPGRPRADLADYIAAAERAEINKRKLVQSNASAQRWYRQARGIVTSPWALPYNSAYDYGAADNSARAVLNGRFVGVDPLDDVDSDILGAALSTTFVVVTRLLEGTATGVEGAFDVGPPAANRIRIPDVRRIPHGKCVEIRDILEEMRDRDVAPPAPSRDAVVDPLRHRLDIAILMGLGHTRGEASGIAGRIYESYARWRAAVEEVEARMREYRREMSRQGRGRSARPVELAARAIWEELQPTLPVYPSDFLSTTDAVQQLDLPRNLRAPAQEPLLQPGFVRLSDGREADLGSYSRVRYAAMLASLGFEPPYDVIVDAAKAGAIADAFGRDLSTLQREARKRAKAYVSDPSQAKIVVDTVRRLWFRNSRSKGMLP